MTDRGAEAHEAYELLRPRANLAHDVVAQVAQQLGITREALLRREPAHLAAARAAANESGFSLAQLLRQHREDRFAGGEYPTAECLSPEQIEALTDADEAEAASEVTDEGMEHLSGCAFCQQLVDAATPSEERWERIRDQVKGEIGVAMQVGSSQMRERSSA